MKPARLREPGAGLPLPELLLLRHWIFPRYMKGKSWQDHFALFLSETDAIARRAAGLEEADFARPALIPRPRGIEDSSRNWSVAMAIEHLMTVADGATRIAAELARGRVPRATVDIARVKPAGRYAALGRDRLVETFVAKARETAAYLAPLETGADARAALPHPWLGPLDAAGWIGLMALHQRLHRGQVEKIIDKLGPPAAVRAPRQA